MGGACTRPALFDTADVVNLYLSNSEMIDYPRAATSFEQIGSHEYSVLCWLAAARPDVAERVYERGGLVLVDNHIDASTPIWRMIIGLRDNSDIEEYKRLYMNAREQIWLAHIVAAI